MSYTDIEKQLKKLKRDICCINSGTSVFSQNIIDALNSANVPDGVNAFATLADLISISPGISITVVANYAGLPNPTTVSGEFYWAEAEQGTEWLPGSWGGTYYPAGIYYSNGIAWIFMRTPFQATQLEVDAGLNNDKFVTPLTFTNASKWNTKANTAHTHTASDITDFDTEVSNNSDVVANTAKVSNATHTGDVTGSTILTLANTAVIPGTYTNTTLTVDSKGRITAASNGVGGGGTPGGSIKQIQYNNTGAFAGATNVEIDDNTLSLLNQTSPTAGINTAKMFSTKVASGISMPAFIGDLNGNTILQPFMGQKRISTIGALGHSSTILTGYGLSITAVGTASAAGFSPGSPATTVRRVRYVGTFSASSVGGYFGSTVVFLGGAAKTGGFLYTLRFSISNGPTNNPTGYRFFAGLRNATGATDVDPSTLVSMIGFGSDAADANIHFMHNDASGTATKINLGVGLPKPVLDDIEVYEIVLYANQNSTTVYYSITAIGSGNTASGSVNTDVPSTALTLSPYAYASAGGVANQIGITLCNMYIQENY